MRPVTSLAQLHLLGLVPHEVRAVAVEAEVSPPTVGAVLSGKPTQPSTRARVLRALRALGLLVDAPAPVHAPPQPMLDGSTALDTTRR